jgi:2-succinyl-5-enolpyruvyl-6-hydroxy-3-cyclohexene-1-carboxylate synthase
LVIQIGEVSEAYEMYVYAANCKELWRVSEDGELRDTWGKLINVFEMPLGVFFDAYAQDCEKSGNVYFETLSAFDKNLRAEIPELPFSNAWLAKVTHQKIPENCKIFLGILNSVRTWGCFPLNAKNRSINSGGFGIDGIISTAVGSSLADNDKLHIVVVGDLAFYYDMNVLGNRHVGGNLRILLVNNKCGSEFRLYSHLAHVLGESADDFVAANGHYINHFDDKVDASTAEAWSKSLGWIYMSANNKDEYLGKVDDFLSEETRGRPMLFEVFTTPENESDGVKMLFSIAATKPEKIILQIESNIKRIVPKSLRNVIKKALKK